MLFYTCFPVVSFIIDYESGYLEYRQVVSLDSSNTSKSYPCIPRTHVNRIKSYPCIARTLVNRILGWFE